MLKVEGSDCTWWNRLRRERGMRAPASGGAFAVEEGSRPSPCQCQCHSCVACSCVCASVSKCVCVCLPRSGLDYPSVAASRSSSASLAVTPVSTDHNTPPQVTLPSPVKIYSSINSIPQSLVRHCVVADMFFCPLTFNSFRTTKRGGEEI